MAEWIELIKEAKRIGLSIEELREYIHGGEWKDK